MSALLPASVQHQRLYRAVWRWHFYAGVFCIPLVLWLSVTGSIYLFKPQVERWLDRPYDHLSLSGPRLAPDQLARLGVAAVPGSTFHYFELPPSDDAAARIIVGVGKQEFRLYLHPSTGKVLKQISEDRRPMKVISRLHGELLVGDWGSRLVELAASWAIVLLVSGLYLWWPRGTERLAGVLWVRFGKGRRIFWRDLHAVTGLWISGLALFLLLTGLPWAKGWGSYFKGARQLTGRAQVRQDWAIGRSGELEQREAMNRNSLAAASVEHADHMGRGMAPMQGPVAYTALNTLVPLAARLRLAPPVLISPATQPGGPWTVRSDAQSRPLRSTVWVDAGTGRILRREDFRQKELLDRIVGTGIAAHEGQLFGFLNQLLGLVTAMGLALLSVSAVVLWWRRRHVGVLGAPVPLAPPRWSFLLTATIVALALYLPAMAVTLLIVLLLEKLVLSRWKPARQWLGLTAA